MTVEFRNNIRLSHIDAAELRRINALSASEDLHSRAELNKALGTILALQRGRGTHRIREPGLAFKSPSGILAGTFEFCRLPELHLQQIIDNEAGDYCPIARAQACLLMLTRPGSPDANRALSATVMPVLSRLLIETPVLLRPELLFPIGWNNTAKLVAPLLHLIAQCPWASLPMPSHGISLEELAVFARHPALDAATRTAAPPGSRAEGSTAFEAAAAARLDGIDPRLTRGTFVASLTLLSELAAQPASEAGSGQELPTRPPARLLLGTSKPSNLYFAAAAHAFWDEVMRGGAGSCLTREQLVAMLRTSSPIESDRSRAGQGALSVATHRSLDQFLMGDFLWSVSITLDANLFGREFGDHFLVDMMGGLPPETTPQELQRRVHAAVQLLVDGGAKPTARDAAGWLARHVVGTHRVTTTSPVPPCGSALTLAFVQAIADYGVACEQPSELRSDRQNLSAQLLLQRTRDTWSQAIEATNRELAMRQAIDRSETAAAAVAAANGTGSAPRRRVAL